MALRLLVKGQGLIRVSGELPRFRLVFVRPRTKMRGFFLAVITTHGAFCLTPLLDIVFKEKLFDSMLIGI